MAPPFLYAPAVNVWQGRTSGANLTLDIRFPGRLSTLISHSPEFGRCRVWSFGSSGEGETGPGVGAQQLRRHLGLSNLEEGLTAAMQGNDVIHIDLFQACNGLAHIILLVGREMKTADHRVHLPDAGCVLRLPDRVDDAAMAA